MAELSDVEISAATIASTAAALESQLVRTPVHHWHTAVVRDHLGPDTEVQLKLELLQHTGTFKARGALNVMRHFSPAEQARGITAISAGNHAIAAAWVAAQAGVPAKVVMLRKANASRVQRCAALGAELLLVDDAEAGFALVDKLVQDEGLSFIHPFEGPYTSLGTATLGLEFSQQVSGLDAVIVPIGGGGLASGVAAAIKLCAPGCKVYGVEPEGAPTMTASFSAGEPTHLETMDTVADSLAAPFTGPTSYALCRQYLDDIVLVSDQQILAAQALAFDDLKLALEPAGAASTAALWGPLRERLRGQKVGVIVCGTNIDAETFGRQLTSAN
ncbi:MAG: threonine dehydratase [Pseudohongiellaceae bacterium]|jgi:threonine dehydratase